MIKSDILKFKLNNSSFFDNKSNSAVIKNDVREHLVNLRANVFNLPTKKIFFGKLVLGDFTGINFLNMKYKTRSNLFGFFIKTSRKNASGIRGWILFVGLTIFLFCWEKCDI
jgi:hypothetical protein